MSEAAPGPRPTAGALLRAARERQGLHIAALAAAIKVTPRKLDALEHDRYDELPDATFTRALAQTVCRTLKIDPRPVLALLPQPDLGPPLEHVAGSLNTPFRERSGRDDTGFAASAIRPLVWASGVLMVAALVVQFLPDRLWTAADPAAVPASAALASGAAPEPAASVVPAGAGTASAVVLQPPAAAAAASTATTPAVVETVHSAPPSDASASTVVPSTLVQLRTTESSWIEVRDARGQLLLSRTVLPGETVGLDGALPMRLTIGNAAATQLGFKGRPVDLAASTRDNVARLELK